MPTICYFEIPAEDIERARNFYTMLFDWKIEKEEGSPDYWRITTSTLNGGVGVPGGLEKRQDSQHRITCHIDVPSIDDYVAKVERLGGKVFVPKTSIHGKGHYAYCLDTENNCFVLWEVDKNAP